ncbi:MAG: phosphatase PAP2 family protein [Rhodanobacteraceae bacterium]
MTQSFQLATPARRKAVPAWPLIGACVLIALGFAGLLAAPVHALDMRILLAMRHPADLAQPVGPLWFQGMLRDFVGLGGIGVLVLFIAGGLGVLWLSRRHGDAWWFLGGVIGAFIIASVMKHLIGRPRPQLIPHETYVFTASFPSGNTMMAMVVWLLLAFAVADAVGKRAVRDYAVFGALVITFLVGAGRVYMGVHWPSDVIEAWGLGIAWVWVLRYARGGRVSVPR